MIDDKKIDWIRLFCTPSIGSVTFRHLIAKFGDATQAINNLPLLANKLGRGSYQNKQITIPTKEWAAAYAAKCEKNGVFLVASYEKEFPKRFLATNDYPAILHVKCKKSLFEADFLNQDSLAVIGARNASLQGISFTSKITADLCANNLVIVSGLARGVDSAAHKAALSSGTIAVVGCGVDVVYPPENKELYDQIIANGAVVSEMLLGREPRGQSFSYRNRIISGMSLGVLVIEAAMKSGSLVTARYAAEQGRDVFAIPGHPYDVRAQGANYLIRNGAILTENASQILEGIAASRNKYVGNVYAQINLEEEQAEYEEYTANIRTMLLDGLSYAPISIGEIMQNIGDVRVQFLQAALAELELMGAIEIDGNIVRRI